MTDPSIRAYPDGPFLVRGEVAVLDEDGQPVVSPTIVALCRCGRSQRQPICDGLHAIGGTDESQAMCERRSSGGGPDAGTNSLS